MKVRCCLDRDVRDRREVIKIIFEYFESIEQEWARFQEAKKSSVDYLVTRYPDMTDRAPQ